MTKAGKLIKEARTKLRMPQAKLAALVDRHAQQLSNIERGRVLCPLELGRRIAFELGIPALKMKKALSADILERKWNE
jgi:DNA-binding XRE family transcriptional regulator